MGVVLAVEIVVDKGWNHLWLECDSAIVVQAFSSRIRIPWTLVNRWNKCLQLVTNIKFGVSHILREGNVYADKIASFGIDQVFLTIGSDDSCFA